MPFDPQAFAHPGPEHRGCPFWCWNARLDRDRLLRQIGWLAEMGMGGWHIHSRTGLATPYLGPEFLACVQECVAEGIRRGGYRTWLYDEDRWPSGFAGGLVTRDPAHRARYLVVTPRPEAPEAGAGHFSGAHSSGGRSAEGRLVARWEVELAADGALASYRRLAEGEAASGRGAVWHAFLERAQPSTWFNGQTYVDTLSAEAIGRFIATTHEVYREAVGGHFGGAVPAIFTDEPQTVQKTRLARPHDRSDLVLPWNESFAATYRERFGADPLDTLPELVWDAPAPAPHRWRYHEHVAERFTVAFADQIGRWCGGHGLALTGHFMSEDTLQGQTVASGEAMRGYRALHIPGIDVLGDSLVLVTAKQAQSAKHQYGRNAMAAELYGLTNWDFTFLEYKRQGDWLAALGVTVRVHHLALMSLRGEAKRDYPASISYQSPWYAEYPAVEDHFARVNSVLTRGRPVVRIAVVHPVESLWLAFGPVAANQARCAALEEMLKHLVEGMLFAQLDFDFLAESLLPDLCPAGAAPLAVGAMRYDAVVVPPLATIRASTLERLEAFAAAGGTLLFLGAPPPAVDCLPSRRALALAERAQRIDSARSALVAALEPFRELAVQDAAGAPAASVLAQIRQDGDERQVFFCNTSMTGHLLHAAIALRGGWEVESLDTETGAVQPLPATVADGWTRIEADLHGGGHVLLRLLPRLAAPVAVRAVPERRWSLHERLDGRYPVTLSEPNALLLDQAAWRLGDGAWQPVEEMLRIDGQVRRLAGLPANNRHACQPWADAAPEGDACTVALRLAIRSEVEIAAPRLAVEDLAGLSLRLDGVALPVADAGWWVDEDIRTVPLPRLSVGDHLLEVVRRYDRRSSLEWMYLLGDFGVRLEGRRSVAIAPPRSLVPGDWCGQGLPFYSGNLTYRIPVEGGGPDLRLAIPHLGGPVAAVALDGRRVGRIWRPPYRLELGRLEPGRHELAITVCGSRHNAFGPLHLHIEGLPKHPLCFPPSWRTDGDLWSYEYQVHAAGLLAAPYLETAEPAG